MAKSTLPTSSFYTIPMASPMGKPTKKPSSQRRLALPLPRSWSTTVAFFDQGEDALLVDWAVPPQVQPFHFHARPAAVYEALGSLNKLWPFLPFPHASLASSHLSGPPPLISDPVQFDSKRVVFGCTELLVFTSFAWTWKEFMMWFIPFSFCLFGFNLMLQGWCAQPYPVGNEVWLFHIECLANIFWNSVGLPLTTVNDTNPWVNDNNKHGEWRSSQMLIAVGTVGRSHFENEF